jgi:monofunctional biosynthetic peptidoglycan transglycosylase
MSFKSQGFGSWIALSIFLSVVVSTVLSWVLLQGFQREFPDVTLLKQRYPVVIYSGRGKPFTVGWRSQRPMQWVSLGQISRVALGAVVVSEDWSFYSHKGYDPVAIREAIVEDLEEGRFARGASTLTQQVAKNVFLERDKTLWRKFKELWLALELEEKVGKKRILETYFNIAEWGEGIFGIQAASRHYFRKTPSELTAREGAFLAMLLPSPKKYSISYRQGNLTRYARRTVHSILLKMWRGGYLSETEYRAALASRMGFEGPAETETDSEKDQTDIDETATEEETEDGSDGAETEAPSAESVSSGADSRGSEDETEKAQQPSESRDSE